MDEEIYKENILDHYKNPRNKCKINNCISCKENNSSCGDEVEIFLKIKNNKCECARFLGEGCAISQASISMLTEKLEGMSVDEIKKLTKQDILDMLGIKIGFGRMKCALLSLKVAIKAVDQYKENIKGEKNVS